MSEPMKQLRRLAGVLVVLGGLSESPGLGDVRRWGLS